MHLWNIYTLSKKLLWLTPGCWGRLCHYGRSWGWSGQCCVPWWWAWPGVGGWGSPAGSGTGRERTHPHMACRMALWSGHGSAGYERKKLKSYVRRQRSWISGWKARRMSGEDKHGMNKRDHKRWETEDCWERPDCGAENLIYNTTENTHIRPYHEEQMSRKLNVSDSLA